MRRILLLLLLVLIPSLVFSEALTREQVVDAARKAGESRVAKAYEKWAKKNGTEKWTPPTRTKPWLDGEPTSVTEEHKDTSWTVEWKNYPPAGWTWECRVHVDGTGKAHVQKAEASFPSH